MSRSGPPPRADGFDFGGEAAEALGLGAAFGQDPFDAGPAGGAGLGGEFGEGVGCARLEGLAPVAVIDAHRAGGGRAGETPNRPAERFARDVP